jgi:hypothetical protein
MHKDWRDAVEKPACVEQRSKINSWVYGTLMQNDGTFVNMRLCIEKK